MWNSSWLKVCKSLFEFTDPITSFKGNSQICALCIGWQKIVAFLNSSGASPVVSVVKNPLPMQETQETWVWFLGQEDPLEKKMASHSTPVFLPGKSHGQRSWRATVHGATKNQTWLSECAHTHTHTHCYHTIPYKKILIYSIKKVYLNFFILKILKRITKL